MSKDKLCHAYGYYVVEYLLSFYPERIVTLWFCHGVQNERIKKLSALAENVGLTIQLMDKKQLDKLIDGGVHQGVVAQVKPKDTVREEHFFSKLAKTPAPLLLILNSIQDPHNLGACLRTAVANKVDAVIVPMHNSVSITAVVRKVSCGASEMIDLVVATNLSRLITKLKTHNIWCYGASDAAEHTISQCDFVTGTAIVLGNEAKGISPIIQQSCDRMFRIPTGELMPSLNVSVATGVCLYEVNRQRANS